jgi:hypothetical protein
VLGATLGLDAAGFGLETSFEDAGPAPVEAAPPVCPEVDGGCALLSNCGAKIALTQVGKAAPVPAGGVVVAGTYVLSAYTLYTGVGGATGTKTQWRRETQTITDVAADAGADAEATASFAWADISESDTSPEAIALGTLGLTAPSSAAIVTTCPSGQSAHDYAYTATATRLVFFFPDAAGTGALVYDRS